MIKSRTLIRSIFEVAMVVLALGSIIGGLLLWLLAGWPEWIIAIVYLVGISCLILLCMDMPSRWFPDEYSIDIETSGLNPHTEYLNWQGSDPEKYKQEMMKRIEEVSKVIAQKTSVSKSRLGELQYQPMPIPDELTEPLPGKYSLKNTPMVLGNPDYHMLHMPGLQEC